MHVDDLLSSTSTLRASLLLCFESQASFSEPTTYSTLYDPTAEQGFEIPPLRVWGLWAEYWDPPSHCCYYFNRQTQASTWEMPAGMQAALGNEDREETALGSHASSKGGQNTSFKMKR